MTSEILDVFTQIAGRLIQIIGGLAIFLFGMKMMSEGLHKSAGDRMRSILNVMTGNRVSGVLTGIGTTSLIQSSSATTVMTVSLVNAGLMSLRQSVGVIMGANIGTTLTAWIIAIVGFKFKIAHFALPAIVLSLPLHFNKNEKARDISEVLLGFGLLFLGLSFMKEGVPSADLQSNPELLSFIQHFTNSGYLSILIFVFLGTLLTVVVQSSSAAMSITLTLAFKGWINFEIAAAIVLGENIGTTITAFIASLEMSPSAKQAARAHMIFNLFGIVWIFAFLYPVLDLVKAIVPGSIDNPESLPIHMSAFHTFFNVVNTFLLIWFVPQLVFLVKKMIPDRGPVDEGPFKMPPITTNLPDSAEINLINAGSALGKMAERVLDMYVLLLNSMGKTGKDLKKNERQLFREEEYIDTVQEELTRYYSECAALALSDWQATVVSSGMRIINELEEISDACYKAVFLFARRDSKDREFHKKAMQELTDYSHMVLDFLRYNSDYLLQKIGTQNISLAKKMEDSINNTRNDLNKVSRKAIKKGADIKGELLYMDIVRQFEHIADFSLIISREIQRMQS